MIWEEQNNQTYLATSRRMSHYDDWEVAGPGGASVGPRNYGLLNGGDGVIVPTIENLDNGRNSREDQLTQARDEALRGRGAGR